MIRSPYSSAGLRNFSNSGSTILASWLNATLNSAFRAAVNSSGFRSLKLVLNTTLKLSIRLFVIPLSLEKYNSIIKFAINRFFRIYPLYCFILFLTLMLYFINVAGLWLDVRDNILVSIGINLFMLQ